MDRISPHNGFNPVVDPGGVHWAHTCMNPPLPNAGFFTVNWSQVSRTCLTCDMAASTISLYGYMAIGSSVTLTLAPSDDRQTFY